MKGRVMVDTLHLGIRFKYKSVEAYKNEYKKIERFIRQVDDSKYHTKYLNFKSSSKKDAPEYLRKIRLFNPKNTNQYVLIKFMRVNGYSNSFDVKLISDLSHFKRFSDFKRFLLKIGNGDEYWSKLIESAQVSSIHIKTDVPIKFEYFRLYLLYPNPDNPRILKRRKKRRTLYLTKNFYIYEKKSSVRLEKRFVTKRSISKVFGTSNFMKMFNKSFQVYPYSDLSFINLTKPNLQLNHVERSILMEAIQIMNNDDFCMVDTKKGKVREYRNSLLNARQVVNKNHKNAFTQKVLRKMETFKVDMNLWFEIEKKQFLSGVRYESKN